MSPPGAQVSLEQQAYMLLTEPERQTMAYYLQEYHEGHIGVEPLAMALFELFNTHAKVQQLQTKMYEVHEIIIVFRLFSSYFLFNLHIQFHIKKRKEKIRSMQS